MKNWRKIIAAAALSASIAIQLTGCGSSKGETSAEASGGTSAETSGETSAKTSEVSEDSFENEDGYIDYSALSEEELDELYKKEPAYNETIVLNYDGGLCPVAIPVALHNGFLEDEGITNTKFLGVMDVREALMSGELTVAVGFMSDWLISYQGGTEVVSTLALHTGCASAAVLADSDYDEFEKGMKVGVRGQIGGVMHNIGLRFVNHDGFSSDDFEWLALDPGVLLSALQEGQVDAIVGSDEQLVQWENDGLVKIIRSQSTDSDFTNETCCTLGFRKEWVEENPVTTYKITRAIYKASLWLAESEENRDEAVDLLLENGYISGTKELGMQLINSFHFGLGVEDMEKSLNDMAKEYKELGVLYDDFDINGLDDKILIKYNLDELAK